MSSELARYVNLFGVIENKDVRLDFVMPVADSTTQWPVTDATQFDPAVLIEFENKAGATVLRYPIGIQVLCAHPVPGVKRTQDSRILAGVVPMPTDASLLKIVDSTSVLFERGIPQDGPVVEITWQPDQVGTGSLQKIHWKATHPEGEPITHTLCIVQADETWQPLTFPSAETETVIDFDELPGGTVRLGVISTDGFHLTKATSSVFELPLKPCVPHIISPTEGQRFDSKERVRLSGSGHYREKGEPEVRWLFWLDDVQGSLGPGREFDVALKPGKHQITLRAGSPGREGEVNVSVFID